MRVDHQNIPGIGGNQAFDSVASVAAGISGGGNAAEKNSNDVVALSNASSLVMLAKNAGSPERQSKLSDISAQLRSGQYQPNEFDLSEALINSLQKGAGGSR